MKALAWLKTAVGRLVQGAAGWKVYAALVAAVLILVGGSIAWLNHKVAMAFEAGQKAALVEQLQGEVSTLRSLADANKESSDEISKNLEILGGVRARVDELERLRKHDARRIAELLRTAPESAVRASAEAAERDIAVVERSRDGFAEEALRASTSAHGWDNTMRARREAIRAQRDASKPKRPE